MSEKETDVPKTLGQAIDEIIRALEPLEKAHRITAIKASCEHLDILLGREGSSAPIPAEPLTPKAPTTPHPMDIKSLKEQKKPTSANEMTALVAFYLAEVAPERKTEVEKEDMVKYFKQAGFPLPSVLKNLLPNAKNAGYFDFVGNGKYKLNPVGYNLVAYNLPRSQSQIATKPVRTRKPHKAKRSRPSRKS